MVVFLVILTVFVIKVCASAQNKTDKDGRYQIIEAQYDKTEDAKFKEGTLLDQAETWKKLNRYYGVFKIDTWTGKTWIFKSTLDEDGQILFVWVEIVAGYIKLTK